MAAAKREARDPWATEAEVRSAKGKSRAEVGPGWLYEDGDGIIRCKTGSAPAEDAILLSPGIKGDAMDALREGRCSGGVLKSTFWWPGRARELRQVQRASAKAVCTAYFPDHGCDHGLGSDGDHAFEEAKDFGRHPLPFMHRCKKF